MPDESLNRSERDILLSEIQALKNENIRLSEELDIARSEAAIDHLTKLPTRRVLDIDLPKELSSVQRGEQGLAVVFFDLDDFKKINDTAGHIQGDKVLVGFSQVIKESLRGTDSIYRLGGEEFVVLLPHNADMGEDLIMEILQRYQKKINQVSRTKDKPSPLTALTASIGCLIITPYTKIGLEEAVDRADALMYNSKHSGKNKSTVAII